MKLFTSKREKRLWLFTGLIVLAIYSTLGLATELARFFQDNETISVGLFIAGCLLILVSVLTQGLKTRPSGMQVFVGLGIVGAYLMVFVRMASSIERSHVVEYGVLAIFILEALAERRNQGKKVPFFPVLAILSTAVIGVIDELIQVFIPSRVFDPLDILFNVFSATMDVLASLALNWAQKKVKKN